jgi:hypothetical protein
MYRVVIVFQFFFTSNSYYDDHSIGVGIIDGIDDIKRMGQPYCATHYIIYSLDSV